MLKLYDPNQRTQTVCDGQLPTNALLLNILIELRVLNTLIVSQGVPGLKDELDQLRADAMFDPGGVGATTTLTT
jgi:hypothetical protein